MIARVRNTHIGNAGGGAPAIREARAHSTTTTTKAHHHPSRAAFQPKPKAKSLRSLGDALSLPAGAAGGLGSGDLFHHQPLSCGTEAIDTDMKIMGVTGHAMGVEPILYIFYYY